MMEHVRNYILGHSRLAYFAEVATKAESGIFLKEGSRTFILRSSATENGSRNDEQGVF